MRKGYQEKQNQKIVIACYLAGFIGNYSQWFQIHILKLGYKNDSLDLQGFFKQFALYLQLLGFQVSHNKHLQAVITQQNFTNELYYQKCIESISIVQIILLYIFAIVINQQHHIMKSLFQALFLCLILHIFDCLRFLYRYIRYGPHNRVIRINGQQIRNLSQEEIDNQYLRFKSEQQFIFVDISNFDKNMLSQLIIQLLNSNKFFLITQKFDFQLNQFSRILFHQDKQSFDLNMNSIWVAEAALQALDRFQEKFQSIHINCTNEIQILIENYIIQNFQIIPILKVQFQNQRFQKIILEIKNEIMKFIIYQKHLKQYLVINPQMVYYDLYDM
ncbi:hypothetical protein ABPG72_017190 [Tetrahymena utriculariae]